MSRKESFLGDISDPWHDNVPDVVVGEVVLREGDVGGHHGAHAAGHHPVLVQDDAGGHHQAGVREETSVVDVKDLA